MTGRIELLWQSYKSEVMPPNAPVIQITECRRAFYAGVSGIITEIITMLDPGDEPTETDLRKMDDIQEELNQFYNDTLIGKN